MKKFILIFLTILLESCITPLKEPIVIIENKTGKIIDSISVFTSSTKPTSFYSIKPNQKVKGEIFFKDDKKDDGCYKLEIYYKENYTKNKCFGYYTNGASLNREFLITIEKDTILVKEN